MVCLGVARRRAGSWCSWRRGGIQGALALAIASTAVAAPAPVAAPEARHPAAGVFRVYCSECHGLSADGLGPRASRLDPSPADLTHLAARHGGLPPSEALLGFTDPRAFQVRLPCSEKLFRDVPSFRGIVSVRRGTALSILDYLETLQQTE